MKALREHHSSLLPVGIIKVQKNFDAGDLIEVLDENGEKVARGITDYSSENLKLVIRHKTAEVHQVLGDKVPDEVIHKNNLVVF